MKNACILDLVLLSTHFGVLGLKECKCSPFPGNCQWLFTGVVSFYTHPPAVGGILITAHHQDLVLSDFFLRVYLMRVRWPHSSFSSYLPVAHGVEHFFQKFIGYLVSFFCNLLNQILYLHFYWLYILLISRGSLYILDLNPLLIICIGKIVFLHSVLGFLLFKNSILINRNFKFECKCNVAKFINNFLYASQFL